MSGEDVFKIPSGYSIDQSRLRRLERSSDVSLDRMQAWLADNINPDDNVDSFVSRGNKPQAYQLSESEAQDLALRNIAKMNETLARIQRQNGEEISPALAREMTGFVLLDQARSPEGLTLREYYKFLGNQLMLSIKSSAGRELTDAQQQNIQARIDSLDMNGLRQLQALFESDPETALQTFILATQQDDTTASTLQRGLSKEIKYRKQTPDTPPPINPKHEVEDRPMTFEEVFKLERGVEYSQEKVQQYFESASEEFRKIALTKKYENYEIPHSVLDDMFPQSNPQQPDLDPETNPQLKGALQRVGEHGKFQQQYIEAFGQPYQSSYSAIIEQYQGDLETRGVEVAELNNRKYVIPTRDIAEEKPVVELSETELRTFSADVIYNMLSQASQMLHNYYDNIGVLSGDAAAEGFLAIADFAAWAFTLGNGDIVDTMADKMDKVDELLGKATLLKASPNRGDAEALFKEVTGKDFNPQAIQKFAEMIQRDISPEDAEYKQAMQEAFGDNKAETAQDSVETQAKAGSVMDIVIMLMGTEAISGANWFKNLAGATMKTLGRTGGAMAMGGLSIGLEEGIRNTTNVLTKTAPATAEDWQNAGKATMSAAAIGVFGGFFNTQVVSRVERLIANNGQMGMGKAFTSLVEKGEMSGEDLLSTFTKSMDATSLRTIAAKSVGFVTEVAGFTGYEVMGDIISDITSGSYEVSRISTVDDMVKYLEKKFGEQLKALGEIKGIAQLMMMLKGGRAGQEATMSLTERLRDYKVKPLEGGKSFEVTKPDGTKFTTTQFSDVIGRLYADMLGGGITKAPVAETRIEETRTEERAAETQETQETQTESGKKRYVAPEISRVSVELTEDIMSSDVKQETRPELKSIDKISERYADKPEVTQKLNELREYVETCLDNKDKTKEEALAENDLIQLKVLELLEFCPEDMEVLDLISELQSKNLEVVKEVPTVEVPTVEVQAPVVDASDTIKKAMDSIDKVSEKYADKPEVTQKLNELREYVETCLENKDKTESDTLAENDIIQTKALELIELCGEDMDIIDMMSDLQGRNLEIIKDKPTTTTTTTSVSSKYPLKNGVPQTKYGSPVMDDLIEKYSNIPELEAKIAEYEMAINEYIDARIEPQRIQANEKIGRILTEIMDLGIDLTDFEELSRIPQNEVIKFLDNRTITFGGNNSVKTDLVKTPEEVIQDLYNYFDNNIETIQFASKLEQRAFKSCLDQFPEGAQKNGLIERYNARFGIEDTSRTDLKASNLPAGMDPETDAATRRAANTNPAEDVAKKIIKRAVENGEFDDNGMRLNSPDELDAELEAYEKNPNTPTQNLEAFTAIINGKLGEKLGERYQNLRAKMSSAIQNNMSEFMRMAEQYKDNPTAFANEIVKVISKEFGMEGFEMPVEFIDTADQVGGYMNYYKGKIEINKNITDAKALVEIISHEFVHGLQFKDILVQYGVDEIKDIVMDDNSIPQEDKPSLIHSMLNNPYNKTLIENIDNFKSAQSGSIDSYLVDEYKDNFTNTVNEGKDYTEQTSEREAYFVGSGGGGQSASRLSGVRVSQPVSPTELKTYTAVEIDNLRKTYDVHINENGIGYYIDEYGQVNRFSTNEEKSTDFKAQNDNVIVTDDVSLKGTREELKRKIMAQRQANLPAGQVVEEGRIAEQTKDNNYSLEDLTRDLSLEDWQIEDMQKALELSEQYPMTNGVDVRKLPILEILKTSLDDVMDITRYSSIGSSHVDVFIRNYLTAPDSKLETIPSEERTTMIKILSDMDVDVKAKCKQAGIDIDQKLRSLKGEISLDEANKLSDNKQMIELATTSDGQVNKFALRLAERLNQYISGSEDIAFILENCNGNFSEINELLTNIERDLQRKGLEVKNGRIVLNEEFKNKDIEELRKLYDADFLSGLEKEKYKFEDLMNLYMIDHGKHTYQLTYRDISSNIDVAYGVRSITSKFGFNNSFVNEQTRNSTVQMLFKTLNETPSIEEKRALLHYKGSLYSEMQNPSNSYWKAEADILNGYLSRQKTTENIRIVRSDSSDILANLRFADGTNLQDVLSHPEKYSGYDIQSMKGQSFVQDRFMSSTVHSDGPFGTKPVTWDLEVQKGVGAAFLDVLGFNSEGEILLERNCKITILEISDGGLPVRIRAKVEAPDAE